MSRMRLNIRKDAAYISITPFFYAFLHQQVVSVILHTWTCVATENILVSTGPTLSHCTGLKGDEAKAKLQPASAATAVNGHCNTLHVPHQFWKGISNAECACLLPTQDTNGKVKDPQGGKQAIVQI